MIVSRKGMYSIEKSGFKDKITVLTNPMSSVAFHLCISNHSKYIGILNKFDKIIKEMKSEGGIIEQIIRKYY